MKSEAPVLVVDLDGTLARTDTLWEALVSLLRRRPWRILAIPFWLLRGRAYVKARLLAEAPIAVERLPYCEELLTWLRQERQRGRTLLLATASTASVGEAVARHLALFDAVITSSETYNARGEHKLQLLRRLLGERPFEYVGNSPADFPLWEAAVAAHVVGTPGFVRRVQRRFPLGRVFIRRPPWGALLRLVRLHQWVKNALVFVPIVLAHRVTAWELWALGIAAAVALGLVASGLYVVNDLLDVEADRAHPRKRKRPLAAGDVPLWMALLIAPLLVAGGFGLAWAVLPVQFMGALGLYAAASALYSFWLKTVPLVDVIVLAGLYTVRILAGSWATGIPASGWLLTFAIFLFLSLAFLKRYVELRTGAVSDQSRRGYESEDAALIRSFGTASGYLAVLVFVLYLNSPAAGHLYQKPQWLWLSTPLLVYWIAHLWLHAHRGRMHDDPLLFVLRDPISYAVVVGLAGILLLATS